MHLIQDVLSAAALDWSPPPPHIHTHTHRVSRDVSIALTSLSLSWESRLAVCPSFSLSLSLSIGPSHFPFRSFFISSLHLSLYLSIYLFQISFCLPSFSLILSSAACLQCSSMLLSLRPLSTQFSTSHLSSRHPLLFLTLFFPPCISLLFSFPPLLVISRLSGCWHSSA